MNGYVIVSCVPGGRLLQRILYLGPLLQAFEMGRETACKNWAVIGCLVREEAVVRGVALGFRDGAGGNASMRDVDAKAMMVFVCVGKSGFFCSAACQDKRLFHSCVEDRNA